MIYVNVRNNYANANIAVSCHSRDEKNTQHPFLKAKFSIKYERKLSERIAVSLYLKFYVDESLN